MKNFYDILGVGRNATKAEIKKAYINELKKYHPDVTEFDKLYAEERTKEIIEAFGILSDDDKRAGYDELLNGFENLSSSESSYSSRKENRDSSEFREEQSKGRAESENFDNASAYYTKRSSTEQSNGKTSGYKHFFGCAAVVFCVLGVFMLSQGEVLKPQAKRSNISLPKINKSGNSNTVSKPAVRIEDLHDYNRRYRADKDTVMRSTPDSNGVVVHYIKRGTSVMASWEVKDTGEKWRRCQTIVDVATLNTGWILESDIKDEEEYKKIKAKIENPMVQSQSERVKASNPVAPAPVKRKEFVPNGSYNVNASRVSIPNDFAIGSYRLGMPLSSPSSLQSALGNIVDVQQQKFSNFVVRNVIYQNGRITINGSGNLSAMRISGVYGMSTPRGIRIGSSAHDVLNAYGKPGSRSRDNLYSYLGGDGSEVYFVLSNGKVIEMGFYYPSC